MAKSTVTLNMLLDPRGETNAAFKVAAMSKWLPKSQVFVRPVIEDGQYVKIRMREYKYLHPRASLAQRQAYRLDPWKKNPDGSDFTYDAYGYEVTMPKWLAEKGFNHFEEKTFKGMIKAARELMDTEAA